MYQEANTLRNMINETYLVRPPSTAPRHGRLPIRPLELPHVNLSPGSWRLHQLLHVLKIFELPSGSPVLQGLGGCSVPIPIVHSIAKYGHWVGFLLAVLEDEGEVEAIFNSPVLMDKYTGCKPQGESVSCILKADHRGGCSRWASSET